MSLRACLVLALLTGLVGLGLRLVVPVTPVDQDYRDVIAYYRSLPAGRGALSAGKSSQNDARGSIRRAASNPTRSFAVVELPARRLRQVRKRAPSIPSPQAS